MFFYYVDSKMISCAQWIVRQCELYTKITRATLGEVLISIFKIVHYMYLMLFGLFFFLGAEDPAFLSMYTVFACMLYIITFALIEIIKTYSIHIKKSCTQKNDILPVEIERNKITRISLFVATILESGLFLLASFQITLYVLLFSVLLFTLVIISVIEYYLCTTSLPPGEMKSLR